MILKQILAAVINLVMAIVTVFLGLRIILRLFGANPENNIVNWIYQTSGEIIGPFRGIFPQSELEGFVIDFTAIFALFVYGLIAVLALYIVNLLLPSTTDRR